MRRACTLFKVARSASSYHGRKAAGDAPVVERMKEPSGQYALRLSSHPLLGRDGYRMSPGRADRRWRAAGLHASVRRSGSLLLGRDRKRRAGRTRYGPRTLC